MKRAAIFVIPAALFALAMYGIISGIQPMVSKENNNRVHALLLGCQLLGSSADIKNVLYFDCAGRIELHKEINWGNL